MYCVPHFRGNFEARCAQRNLPARDNFGDKKPPWWHCRGGAIPSPCPGGAFRASWLSAGSGNGVAWGRGDQEWEQGCTRWLHPLGVPLVSMSWGLQKVLRNVPVVSSEAAAPCRLRQGESVPLRFAGSIAQEEERAVPHRDGASAKTRAVCMVRGSSQVAGEHPTQPHNDGGACRIPVRSTCPAAC